MTRVDLSATRASEASFGDRPGVQELLDLRTRRRLCVVIGAAGWGKSTAVASWARGRHSAWMSGHDHAADPIHFANGLVDAFRPHLPPPPPRLEAMAPGGDLSVDDFLGYLHDWLGASRADEIVLVLDDLQELPAGGESAVLVEALCRQLPDLVRVVLLSRREPPFSLERLRGQGLVDEIAARELAFDVADVVALLGPAAHDPPGLPVRLWERTEGWPAAVNAAVEALRGTEPGQRLDVLERVTRPGEHFHRYLAEEVVDTEPAPVRELLRRLAVIGEARSTTSLAMPGAEDATRLLADLARRGVVRRSSGEGDRWSLVQPLQDYFDHDSVLPAADRTLLYLTAAQECQAREAWAEALRHLTAARSHAACAAVLVEHGEALVNSGQVEAVLHAGDLPGEYSDDPRIQRVLGHAQQVRGTWAAAMECFQRAGRDHAELEPSLAWRVGTLAFSQGELREVLAVLDRTRFAKEDSTAEVRMLVLAAASMRMVGDADGARRVIDRAATAAKRCAKPAAWAGVYHLRAMSAAADGDRRKADAHCQNALHNAELANDLLQALWIRLCRAFHVLNMGSPRNALAEVQTVLQLSERCQNSFFTAHALTTRGRAHVRLGRLEAGLADLATATDLFQRVDSRFLAWSLCGIGDVHRIRGQLVRARATFEEALSLAEPCNEVFGLRSALIGLARTRAADDLEVASSLANRAVRLPEALREVSAFLTRGWISLLAGNRPSAAADAARAGAAARLRRDGPGLAEAITLSAMSAADPAADSALLGEAIDIWREAGCRVEEATARVLAERVGVPLANVAAPAAYETLQELGVDAESMAAGPLAVPYVSAPGLSIRTLGTFEVVRDGLVVSKAEWRSKKARELLKILVTRRRPVPREQLMELLWPDVPPSKSGNRLSVLLSMVRDVLQPQRFENAPLVTDGSSVWLDRAEVAIDVEDFLDEAAAALDLHRRRQPDAITRLRAAEAAYTGSLLEDDPYQEWAEPLAEEVRAAYVAVLRALTAQLRDTGDTDGMVHYALRLLAHDAFDEEAHVQLVTALTEAGRLGEARRRHEIYVRRMREIGVAPRTMPRVGRPGS